MSKKLEKVLEYLIANEQDKAKELLHQVFIEKARKIHEELISQDDMDEMDELGGDQGDELTHSIRGHDRHLKQLDDEIEAEETMSEDDDLDMGDDDTMGMDDLGSDDDDMGDDEDLDMGDDDMDMGDDDGMGDDDDMGDEDHPEMSDIENTIGDLEDALAALKAEFEKLEGGAEGDDEAEDDMEFDSEEADDDADDAEYDAEDDSEEADAEDDDEEMDESWLEEDFDDLAEAIELEKVSMPGNGEVGSGRYLGTPAAAKSPIATSQTSRMGAKPVTTDSKHHAGYNKETAPTSKDMGLANRRKKADAGMSKVSKEGNGSAAINKTASEFGADTVGKNSPLSKTPRK